MQTSVNERVSKLILSLEKGKQKRFAEAIGVSPTVINNIVAGRLNKPSFDVVQKIIESYPNVDLDWLIMGKGEMLKGTTFSNNKLKGNSNVQGFGNTTAPARDEECRQELAKAKEEVELWRNKYIALLEKSFKP